MDLDAFADTSVYHLTSDGGVPYPPFQSIDAYALTVYTSRHRHVPVTPVWNNYSRACTLIDDAVLK